ncbi:hypothetical protein [Microbacterium sediminis]|uniref:Uncharacterized protein n=1 Tax=Microbacterium sediminis TaxID=904291 RepID=A0A1B9NHA2_9MICO|nr:hypothetical protein [Microbacterium sediminis]OCG75989.1 hypothetical protein A7J15_12935 [Microbacterium sediminis]QBR73392.1 hypothetical protein E3O41_02410 [Microbacterium sediminis]
MTRTASILLALGVIALGTVVGVILQNVLLGILLGLLIALGVFLAFESRRGRNAGVNDEDHGIEL